MVRRPVAWVVAVVLFAEAVGVAGLNWMLGTMVDQQHMSLAGLDPDAMATSSKAAGVVFGLYFAVCGLVALLVALRGRRPAGFGRVLLISAAVVHGLLGAFAWGLVGATAFLFMMVVLGLIVLLLMTYDRAEAGPAGPVPGDGPQDGDDPARDVPAGPGGPAGHGPAEGGTGPADGGRHAPLTPPAEPSAS
ncbi:hypothetical protein ABZ920_09550 [Streptomyces sp. NPDC046831]|uniref:hypothetical protein n=1 Tax=Streptomyces sp. NPDC046831 TaxID=3154805 RepID=UPI0033CEF37E